MYNFQRYYLPIHRPEERARGEEIVGYILKFVLLKKQNIGLRILRNRLIMQIQ